MDANSWIGLAIGCTLLSWFTALGLKCLRGFSRRDLKDVCTARDNLTRLGHILRSHEQVALSNETLQIMATAGLIWSVMHWLHVSDGVQETLLISASTLLLAGLVLIVITSWIPWTLVGLWESTLLYYGWPIWDFFHKLLTPVLFCARLLDTIAHRLAGVERVRQNEETFEEEIRTVVDEGHREGLLKEEAREMIEGIIELSESDVSQIMTPRTDMVGMPLTMTFQEAAEFVSQSSHTRIPVFDKTRDNIVGILHAKDLLAAFAIPSENGNQDRPLRQILREPYFIPETKAVNLLLHEFQQTRNQMAIVLDEYGGVSGLVTIEDVLEEIVGEIVDEYDEDVVDGIWPLQDNTAEALGRIHIDEVNERLGLELPEDQDYDTLAGFVFSELGHVPKVGEEVVWKNVRLTVLDATKRRIERIRIEILDPSWQESA